MIVLLLAAATNVFGILPFDPPALPVTTVKSSLNPAYQRVEVRWSTEQSGPATAITFADEADNRIKSIEAAGIRVLPSIYVGRATWINNHNEPQGSQASASYPPFDLSTTFNPDYGYSQSYYNFVKQYVGHYAGHFDYVAVENEENSILYWGGSSDQYLKLLKTAYLAIKAADPNAKVTDGGMVTGVWGTTIAKDWINTGAKSRSEALQFALDYYTLDQPAGIIDPSVATTTNIGTNIDNPNSDFNTKTFPFVNAVLDGANGAVDVINFHFYNTPRQIGALAGWLRQRTKRAGYTVPVLSNEMSLRVAADQCDPAAPFNSSTLDTMARLVFKYLSASRGNNIGPLIWFSIDTVCDPARTADMYNASLFNQPPSNTLRPSGSTWARVASTLGTMNGTPIAEGPALYEYAFPNGLYAAWSESGTQLLSFTGTSATVTDYAGTVATVQGMNQKVTVAVTAPVFIQVNTNTRRRAARP